MATFNKVNDFVENIAHGVMDLETDQLVVALSNTAPGSEASNPTASGNGVLANVTQISYTNLSSRNITTTSSLETTGTYKLTLNDLVLTASGAVATFRYVYIYNDTPTSPADPIIGYYDYGSSVTLANGETFTVDFDGSNGLLTIA
jgi:hypothetical protein